MNRIDKLFQDKKKDILSVYFTAGYPNLEDTETIIVELEKAGVDLIEIGMPFSDPVADGPVIQGSSHTALENGMTIKRLFKQLENIRPKVKIPLILMGYINPIMQYGIKNFCSMAEEVGIDGTIIPDLPFDLYEGKYKSLFAKANLKNIQLITPQTSVKRLKQIDEVSEGFIYMVSTASTTGAKKATEEALEEYNAKIKLAKVQTPRLIGFGISDKKTFGTACKYSSGGIIGSAFINALSREDHLKENIHAFIKSIR